MHEIQDFFLIITHYYCMMRRAKQFCKLAYSSFYRAMHYSAKRGIETACRLSVCLSVRLSVCDVGGSGPHKLEILQTNRTNN